MSKNINVSDELYNCLVSLAKKENVTIDMFLSNLVTKLYGRDYSEFSNILLEDTHLFNWCGGQSTVFNRLRNNNIKTLKDLFLLYDLEKIDYGVEHINKNFYIHEEIKGIIRLLQFKYLGTISEELACALHFIISGDYTKMALEYKKSYGYPGKVFNIMVRDNYPKSIAVDFVNYFYRMLKLCGFDQIGAKVLIDYAFDKKIDNMSLIDFLLSIDLEEIKDYFKKVPQEYCVFINIYNTLIEFYVKMMEKNKSRNS